MAPETALQSVLLAVILIVCIRGFSRIEEQVRTLATRLRSNGTTAQLARLEDQLRSCGTSRAKDHLIDPDQEATDRTAPLHFLPLADIAAEVLASEACATKQFHAALALWGQQERQELEAFASTCPDADADFSPSTTLEGKLRSWAMQRHKVNLVEGWSASLSDHLVSVLSGRSDVDAARHALDGIGRPSLLKIDCDADHDTEAEIDRIYYSWARNWKAGKWRQRLNVLESMDPGEPNT